MAVLLPGNIYKHRVFCYSGNQVAINTRYFQVVSVTSGPINEDAFIAKLDQLLAALYKPCITNAAQYVGSDMQNITADPPYPLQVGTSANSGNGTAGAQPLPSQVCGIYTVLTPMTGRGNRGRVYVPFPDQSFNTVTTPPTPNAAYAAVLNPLANATVGLVTYTITGVTIIINWAIRHGPHSPGAGGITDTIDFRTRQAWATQRRRGDYGRPNPVPAP